MKVITLLKSVFAGVSTATLLAAGLVLSVPGAATAGQFAVRPIKINLSKDATSVVLTVENQANEPLRLQVTGFAWSQDPKGDIKLAPTDDLIFFPTLVTLTPLESRSIRIGLTTPSGARERSYRIFLEELPSLTSQLTKHAAQRLEVRTKVGVPIFLAPKTETKKSELANVSVHRGNVSVALSNDGSVHNMVNSLRVIAKDTAGAKVFDKSARGWYVLAGGSRDFQMQLSPSECAKARTIDVTADTENGALNRHINVTPADCRS